MRAELVTIGTELLLGFTVDTNGAAIGQALAAGGIHLTRRAAVPDQPEAIESAVREALARAGTVLTTGGLGPTSDDVTKAAVARIFHAPLRFNEGVWREIVARFRRLGREPAEANRSQADVPEGATVLPNRWGTAPGLWLEGEPGVAILLPGVPGEMGNLLRHEVLPRLRARSAGLGDPGGPAPVVRSRLVRTTSMPESTLAERIATLEATLEPLTLAYLPSPEGVDLRLTSWTLPADRAEALLEAGSTRLLKALPDHAYGLDDTDLAGVVLDAARARGLRLAVAESCTGGLLGARLTAVPGSSDVFRGALVCYADQAKVELAGVPADLLARDGAVSREVALALARGACRRLHADAGAGVTGIAGPAGGTVEKPVGLVWFGWVAGDREESTARTFPGDRAEIRARAAQFALHGLARLLATTSSTPGLGFTGEEESQGPEAGPGGA